MSDEIIVQNVAPDQNPAQLNPANDHPGHARTGKIARLPNDLREQVNQRLFDGQPASVILPWLNDLAPVKQILTAQFSGAAINGPNLTHWRQTGYQRWLLEKQQMISIQHRSQYAAGITSADAGHLAPAAAAIASNKILELLEITDPAKADPNHLVKCAFAASVLLEKEQNNTRIRIAHQRLRQRDMALLLKRDKQQRDTVAIARRVLGDARAAAIENSSWSDAEKIEALGIHLFSNLWEPRPIPPSESSVKPN